MAFALGHQSAVAATGADHDCRAVRLLGQVYRKLRLRRVGELTISFRGVTFPERQGFGGEGGSSEREESEEEAHTGRVWSIEYGVWEKYGVGKGDW